MNAVLKPALRIAYDGCPLCKGTSEVLRKETCAPRGRLPVDLTWMKCVACSHVHTAHFFSEEGMTELFRSVVDDGLFGGEIDKQRITWSAVISRLIPYVGDGRWIDVGVGNGGFLFTAAEFGFDVVGIDKRDYVLAPLRALGYQVEESDAMNYDYYGAAVVVLADILEHIPYPKELLARIRQKLRGALFVSCPNMDCVSWRYLDTKAGPPYWQEMEHYHNFTRARLQSLLRECGFTPVYYGVSSRYQAGMEIIAI